MNWHVDGIRFARELRVKAKTAPFPIAKMAYEGMLKHIISNPKSLCFNDTLIMRALIGEWVGIVQKMKNHPEPTEQLQMIQDNDCRRLTDINYRMVLQVIEPIRNKQQSKICVEPVKEMIELMDEFSQRYGQN